MRRVHRKAFTLIELLVVIAIIAILAAILFPTFMRMRAGVHQATCISNMHDIAVKLAAYKDDHGDEYPPMLLGYVERQDGLPWQAGDPTPVEAGQIKHGFLYPTYINDIEKFRCPITPVKQKTAVVAPTYVGPATPYSGTPLFNTQPNSKAGFPFPKLGAPYNGKPIAYYGVDSYDMTTIPGTPNAYRVTYNRDWTGAFGKQDNSNQLKYARSLNADKTVVTWCNIHATVSGFDTSPVLLATGTAKAQNTAKVNKYGWQFAQTP
jgi:prepilin-type N-terminal cleavage/methylation domain-containing protein